MAYLKKYLSVALLALCSIGAAFGQECQFVDPPPPPQLLGGGGGGGSYASWNGWYLPTKDTLRILVVLVEKDNAAGSTDWPAHALPVWATSPDPDKKLFEHIAPTGTATGLFTRYFQEASSGRYTVLADYLTPTTGGIIQSNATLASNYAIPYNAITAANNALGSTIHTAQGFNTMGAFDKWETSTAGTGPGLQKLSTPDGRYDHVMFIWRYDGVPSHINNTGFAVGDSLPIRLLGRQANTYSAFISHNGIPVDIARHEFSHLLYGANNFHIGDAVSTFGQYFVTQGNGWSNMGLYNASLNSWNAWDRQRMGWKAPGSTFEIAARNAGNTAFVNGDLDASVPGGAGTYTLRDFVQTGDALRIKLPFTDPNTEYPEYLWVENHQGKALNGNSFDKWQHEGSGNPCVEPITRGLQMYMQIDKEVRQASSATPIYGGPGDFLRPLDANGHVDEHFDAATQLASCVCWLCPEYPFVRGLANPLTGSADRHCVSRDNNANGQLVHSEYRVNKVENLGGTYGDHLYCFGNTRQVFSSIGSKVGVGTNPSSATMMNLSGYDISNNSAPNLRRIYLNGVSVELMAQNPDGSIQVKVRFDDVDVNKDARWCADEIQLNPVATSTGYSLNVTNGYTVTLDRGTTATRRNAPETWNGQQVFTSATLMRCPANTWLNLVPGGGSWTGKLAISR